MSVGRAHDRSRPAEQIQKGKGLIDREQSFPSDRALVGSEENAARQGASDQSSQAQRSNERDSGGDVGSWWALSLARSLCSGDVSAGSGWTPNDSRPGELEAPRLVQRIRVVVGRAVEVVGERDRFSLLASSAVQLLNRRQSRVEGSSSTSVHPAGMQTASVGVVLKLEGRGGLITRSWPGGGKKRAR